MRLDIHGAAAATHSSRTTSARSRERERTGEPCLAPLCLVEGPYEGERCRSRSVNLVFVKRPSLKTAYPLAIRLRSHASTLPAPLRMADTDLRRRHWRSCNSPVVAAPSVALLRPTARPFATSVSLRHRDDLYSPRVARSARDPRHRGALRRQPTRPRVARRSP